MSDASPTVGALVTYQTIRQEILDQKRCQFHLFSLTVTLTAAVLAYAARSSMFSVIALIPIAVIIMAMLVIIGKAESIQRMVGYLQVMEESSVGEWKWESDLEKFRVAARGGDRRQHSYITTVGYMLGVLNILCVVVYGFPFGGDESSYLSFWVQLHKQWPMPAFDLLALCSIALYFSLFIRKRRGLVAGRFATENVEKLWRTISKASSHPD